ncbi:PorT family protein [Hymenobacter sp. BT664]|uniref:PorT family protein n=1 Tax=Hymenobacter montanus TaxID=2771359 RepID=A0A927BEE8_9BACT|nr:porin family protein [Hymenobacter montanus]MBD2768554.1 PorT family protein [Hymenobacter montanus]
MKHFSSALLLTALVTAGTTISSRAQSVQFSPRLGLNVSSVSITGVPSGFNLKNKSLVGVQAGGTLSIGLTEKLSFQPSLLFSQKGVESEVSLRDYSDLPYVNTATITTTTKLNYLELPLNMVYTLGGAEGFQLFAGPYVAAGVGGSGSYSVEFNSTNPRLAYLNNRYSGSLIVEYGDRQSTNNNLSVNGGGGSLPTITTTARRIDLGLNAGVGYRVGPFQAHLGYGLGLTDFEPNDSNGNATDTQSHHRVFQLSANYFLSGK